MYRCLEIDGQVWIAQRRRGECDKLGLLPGGVVVSESHWQKD